MTTHGRKDPRNSLGIDAERAFREHQTDAETRPTSDPDEWLDITEPGGPILWQNRRNPAAYSTTGGRTWYYDDGRGPVRFVNPAEPGHVAVHDSAAPTGRVERLAAAVDALDGAP